MHAVLITFKSSADLAELEQPFTDFANALREVPGLVSKTWLQDDEVLGGFFVFAGSEEAEAYLGGELAGSLTANPAFSDFQIRHFGVFDQLSAITGTPQLALSH